MRLLHRSSSLLETPVDSEPSFERLAALTTVLDSFYNSLESGFRGHRQEAYDPTLPEGESLAHGVALPGRWPDRETPGPDLGEVQADVCATTLLSAIVPVIRRSTSIVLGSHGPSWWQRCRRTWSSVRRGDLAVPAGAAVVGRSPVSSVLAGSNAADSLTLVLQLVPAVGAVPLAAVAAPAARRRSRPPAGPRAGRTCRCRARRCRRR